MRLLNRLIYLYYSSIEYSLDLALLFVFGGVDVAIIYYILYLVQGYEDARA